MSEINPFRDAVATHPLTKAFWKTTVKAYEKNNSMTEDDFDYSIRLDEETVELIEEQVSYYDSSRETKQTLKGRWEPLRVTRENVALRLSGIDCTGAPAEKVLVLWDDDVDYGDLAWWAQASKQMDDRTITIDLAAAVAHGLPPVRIRVCSDRLSFIAAAFPDAHTYLRFSGPPGGPQFLSLHPLPPGVRDPARLEALVLNRSGADSSFQLGGTGTLEFDGQSCITQLHYSGTQNASMAACSIAVPGGKSGLLVVFGRGGTPANVKDVPAAADHGPIRRLLKRISWETA